MRPCMVMAGVVSTVLGVYVLTGALVGAKDGTLMPVVPDIALSPNEEFPPPAIGWFTWPMIDVRSFEAISGFH